MREAVVITISERVGTYTVSGISAELWVKMEESLRGQLSTYEVHSVWQAEYESLKIVGVREKAEDLKKLAEDCRNQLLEQLRMEREMKRESIILQDYQVAYLHVAKSFITLKKKYKLRELEHLESVVTVCGNFRDVDNCVEEIKKICDLRKLKVTKSSLCIEMYNRADVKERIGANMKRDGTIAVCDAEGSTLTVYSADDQTAQRAIRCFDSVVYSQQYPGERNLTREELDLLQSGESWSEFVQLLKSRHGAELALHPNSTKLDIVGFQHREMVMDEVKKYFASHVGDCAVHEAEPGRMKFIKQYLKEEVRCLERCHSVKVELTSDAVIVSGPAEKVQAVEGDVKRLRDSVVSESHVLEHKCSLALKAQPEVLEDVAIRHQAIILNETSSEQQNSPQTPRLGANSTMTLECGTNVQLMVTDVADVSGCDALLCPFVPGQNREHHRIFSRGSLVSRNSRDLD